MLMLERQPLMAGFGGVAGQWIRQRPRAPPDPGRRRRQGRSSIEGHERVSYVHCSDGARYQADVVICGVGALPDVMLARKAGLDARRGGRRAVQRRAWRRRRPASGRPATCASTTSVVHDGRIMRIEHETVAADQGATVARNMLGAGVAHDAVPVLLLRPRRLGVAGVRRSGAALGRGGRARRPRGRVVQRLVPRGAAGCAACWPSTRTHDLRARPRADRRAGRR